ncbi:unnamed protein product [Anisakis simplex]|uniref:Aldedh domain-containing protein n=1 Tax=Anisakis simplex TaxID=6269 RepID=A0A0M3JKT6_ANISI|nr:unnamed protein product [Anisakis simplex]VDK58549.1 unnamed protein product [Anisakis simplex]
MGVATNTENGHGQNMFISSPVELILEGSWRTEGHLKKFAAFKPNEMVTSLSEVAVDVVTLQSRLRFR